MLLLLCAAGGNVDGAKLHTILICDTHADNIGSSVEADLRNFRNETHRIAQNTTLELSEKLFIGQEVNKEALAFIADLSIDADDAVIFYFSGHGYRPSNVSPEVNQWPHLYLTPADKGVDFLEVAERLMHKNPRLMLVVSDCCNNIIPEMYAPTTMPIPAETPEARGANRKRNYNKLFQESTGYYIITSASPGEFSWGTLGGGIFTNAFLRSLKLAADSHNTADWIAILDRASLYVVNNSEIDNQTPRYEYVSK